MEFNEIKPNNRVQIKCEHEDPMRRTLRGIVLGVGSDSLILVTDYGQLEEVFEHQILHVAQIVLPRPVSDALQQLKNHHEKIYAAELELKELRSGTSVLIESVHDAAFIADFNGFGAKTRLSASIREADRIFKSKGFTHVCHFEPYSDDEVLLIVDVRDTVDYPQFDEDRDVGRILDAYRPDRLAFVRKVFSYASAVQEKEQKVVHEDGDTYSVRQSYSIRIPISKNDFFEVRDQIADSLRRLR